jgi:hypothetical protein
MEVGNRGIVLRLQFGFKPEKNAFEISILNGCDIAGKLIQGDQMYCVSERLGKLDAYNGISTI